jgi:hypothetical protein
MIYIIRQTDMRTVTIIIVTGIILLFLGSLYIGPKVFSNYECRLDRQLTQARHMPPQTPQITRKMVEYKKIRLAFGSFDLMGGLTMQELKDLAKPSPRVLSFFFLFACFWVIFGFKMQRP